MKKNSDGYPVEGLFWMYTISMFVFWVPIFGGLAAGVIGGVIVGGVKDALKASILTAMVFGTILTILILAFQGTGLLLICSFLSPVMLVSSYVLFLMIGAFFGGLSRQFRAG